MSKGTPVRERWGWGSRVLGGVGPAYGGAAEEWGWEMVPKGPAEAGEAGEEERRGFTLKRASS